MSTPRSLPCGTPAVIAAAVGLAVSPARAHVILDDPSGFEELQVGSVYTITWHIFIAHELIDWDLSYSTTSNTGPWITIAENLPPGDPSADSVHTYDWTVPDAVAQFAWVRVRMDNVGTDYYDWNDLPFSIVPPCPWDLDDTGDVGVTDFLNLLADWGMSGVPADFDGGGVGVTDFLVLLAHWGPCP
jgi:hypothetical protein